MDVRANDVVGRVSIIDTLSIATIDHVEMTYKEDRILTVQNGGQEIKYKWVRGWGSSDA